MLGEIEKGKRKKKRTKKACKRIRCSIGSSPADKTCEGTVTRPKRGVASRKEVCRRKRKGVRVCRKSGKKKSEGKEKNELVEKNLNRPLEKKDWRKSEAV